MIPGDKVKDPSSAPLLQIDLHKKLSKKKEKDLEKYIQKKLKKEERGSLFERLQKSSVDTESLQSSRILGQGCKDAESEERVGLKRENREELMQESDRSDCDSSESDHENPYLLRSAEVTEKNPFKATKDHLLSPSFMNSSSDESSSSEDDEEELASRNQVSFMAAPEPVFNVSVERDAEIQEQRSQLPIFAEEQRIMEAIRGNPVVIICGETGSGKTTQVPQFLYEAGFGNKDSANPGLIAVTQPRRVAAVSMAERVGIELGNKNLVAYQIRYDSSSVTSKSVIKFMTDGILLKEIQSDFLLNKYSVILLDEAHERNLNTDILVGLLSRIVRLRWKRALEEPSKFRPLRLIVMSATLNVDEFAKPSLFNPLPPVLRVESRQHPVTVHFNRKTDDDYLTEALKTVSKIHANLPDGGILVFLSGKREILSLVKSLREKYPMDRSATVKDQDESFDDSRAEFTNEIDDSDCSDFETNASLQKRHVDMGDESDFDEEAGFTLGAKTKQPLHVLPLFSLLSPEQQMRIFTEPPAGSRLCVIATNVAETSITIKNIRYVVDSGKVKQRIWDSAGRQRYDVVWTSKASVAQRTGRAGRTGPGHCYRLFSSAVFDHDFPPHSIPEISRVPMEGLVLQLKNMSIDHVEKFPLPTEPDVEQVLRAQKHLVQLGVLDKERFCISKFGRQVALFPLAPTWGTLLVHAMNLACENGSALKFLPIVAAFTSVMTIGDPFTTEEDLEEDEKMLAAVVEGDSGEKQKQLNWREFCGKPVSSDLFGPLGAFVSFLSNKNQKLSSGSEFCARNHLVEKRLEEMTQQLSQLLRMVSDQFPSGGFAFKMSEFSETISSEQKTFIRRLMCQAFPFQIAEKITLNLPLNDPNRKLSSKLPAYRILGVGNSTLDSIHFLHPTSYLLKIPPKYLVFTEALTTRDRKTGANRHYLKNVTAIEPAWIPADTLTNTI